jgi:hypothetical protein
MKTNFRVTKKDDTQEDEKVTPEQKNLTQEKFEEYVSKSGAKGSFMIYRSSKKEQEMGLDEL